MIPKDECLLIKSKIFKISKPYTTSQLQQDLSNGHQHMTALFTPSTIMEEAVCPGLQITCNTFDPESGDIDWSHQAWQCRAW